MKSVKARALVMTLVGFGILIYNAVAYLTGDFRALPFLTIFGLIAVVVGLKQLRNPNAH